MELTPRRLPSSPRERTSSPSADRIWGRAARRQAPGEQLRRASRPPIRSRLGISRRWRSPPPRQSLARPSVLARNDPLEPHRCTPARLAVHGSAGRRPQHPSPHGMRQIERGLLNRGSRRQRSAPSRCGAEHLPAALAASCRPVLGAPIASPKVFVLPSLRFLQSHGTRSYLNLANLAFVPRQRGMPPAAMQSARHRSRPVKSLEPGG